MYNGDGYTTLLTWLHHIWGPRKIQRPRCKDLGKTSECIKKQVKAKVGLVK
jgi:hypothetical protein